jgi:serine/threonine protein kinase
MGKLTENYTIISQLGKGGMGAVYLAQDKRLDRKVAIKVLTLNENLSLEQKSEIIARFQKEAKAIAKLSHPNVVAIHDIGEDNGEYYMVMEFLEGKSIGSILDKDKKLPIQECIDISIQICKALDYIHSNSIVHRDIKPDNIIITKNNIAKITDFGIAQNDSDQMRLTQDGTILGSIMYISPEQLRNSKEVDNRADIFSYGVTLYQMITGKMPFDGETVGEVVTKILSSQPELPRKYNPDIPFELERIIMKALNKDREKRYQNMKEMEKDLVSLLKNTSTNILANTSKNISNSTVILDKKNINLTNTNNLKKDEYKTIKIEKASKKEIFIRTILKIIISIVLINLSYSFVSEFLRPNVLNEILKTNDFLGLFPQGPYSSLILEKKLALKTSFYNLFIVFLFLLIWAFILPIESKGIYRNDNPKSEILPIILSLIIVFIYSLLMFPNVKPFDKYLSAFNKDSAEKITDLSYIFNHKGYLTYSNLDEYKSFYYNLDKKSNKKTLYIDHPEIQVKDNIFNTDYIKLSVFSINNESKEQIIVNDLFDNIFTFNEPQKELYFNKLSELVNIVSEGNISLSENFEKKVLKDELNKVKEISINWDKNILNIKRNSISLKTEDNKYEYPKKTDKNIDIPFKNNTDKKIFVILYSLKDNSKKSYLSINASSQDFLKVREGEDYSLIVLFEDKTIIPYAGNFSFSNGNYFKIDSYYKENSSYYSLDSIKEKQREIVNKTFLSQEGIFYTKDADIISFKLNSLKK